MRSIRVLATLVLVIPLVACQGPRTDPSAAAAPRPVTLLLGFRPDVQFAPFYVAQREGHYEAAGLDVTIEHKQAPDVQPGSGVVPLLLRHVERRELDVRLVSQQQGHRPQLRWRGHAPAGRERAALAGGEHRQHQEQDGEGSERTHRSSFQRVTRRRSASTTRP